MKAELLPGRIWPFSSEAAHGYGALVSHRDRLGRPIDTAAAVIAAKVPVLKGGALVIAAGPRLALEGQAEPEGVDAAARKRVEWTGACLASPRPRRPMISQSYSQLARNHIEQCEKIMPTTIRLIA